MDKAILAFVAFVALLILIVFALDEKACTIKAQSFDDVQYTIVGGCMVKHNDRWLPLDNIRGFDDK